MPIPPFSNYVPNFNLTGGNLPAVYQQPGLPATMPGEATYAPNFQMVNGGLPAVIPQEAAAGMGADASAALGAEPGMVAAAGGTPGLLARLVSAARMAAPYAKGVGIPSLVAGAALANDPGSLGEHNPDGSDDPLARFLNPSSSDTGLTSTVKGMGRGTAAAGKYVDDAIGTGYDYLTQSKADRELRKELKAEKDGSPDAKPNEEQHFTIEQAIGTEPIGQHGGGAANALQGRFAMPEGDASNPGLDSLIGLINKTAPSSSNGASVSSDPEQRGRFENLGAMEGLDSAMGPGQRMSSINPTARALLGLGLGATQGGGKYDQAIAARQLELKEKQADWGIKAAHEGTEIIKEQHKENMDQIKIHATRGGIMIEGTQMGPDGKPMRVIQPIGNAIFNAQAAGALDPKMKTTVMGKTFSGLNNNPMGKETALLGQLEQTGQLQTVMADPRIQKAMKESDKITTKTYAQMGEGKLAQETYNGRRAVLLKFMVENPNFRQDMIDRVGNLRARTGTGANAASALEGDMTGGEQPPMGTMEGDGTDYLTQLTQGQQ